MAQPDPKNPSHRTKAFKLRAAAKRGQKLADVDLIWLSTYEDAQKKENPAQSTTYGRSRSARKVKRTEEIEEAAEAEGTGGAAVEAAKAIAIREEGRRLDALTLNAMEVLKSAAEVNKETALMLREGFAVIFENINRRSEILEETHIEMLQSIRSHFLHATQIEGALMQRDAETKPEDQLLMMLMAKHLGVDPAQLHAAAAAASATVRGKGRGGKQPPNGVPKQ